MLTLHQAIEIKESILEYLKATFTFQDKKVHKAFYDFVTHPREGMFKGPYISLKLPFVQANKAEAANVPLTIKPEWPPYDHQVKTWHRLSTRDKADGTDFRKPQPTIVTTGTGSGKTESFLFPLLDYCYKNHHIPGIKVIILYPMNALATDQAKRLAEAIFEDERLKGKITAGLFIGEGNNPKTYPKNMGADHIIENKEAIVASPPDILLTNFKMLDYGLMKSNYHDLWLGNLKNTDLLQFLVLDELHTYDGAQGTDVANLIRRLKLKLNIPENHLCPVGTSATIGSGEEAPQLLSQYASRIFGETITTDAIITENRMTADVFFGQDEQLEEFLPRPKSFKDIKPIPGEGYDNYLERQKQIWQLDPNDLVTDLKRLKITKDLLIITGTGSGYHTLQEVMRLLSIRNQTFNNIPQWDQEFEFNPKEAIIQSLMALIAQAKVIDPGSGRKSPLLYTQIQLWIRELSGVLRLLNESPEFTWRENANVKDEVKALPPWFCRECGASGWLGLKHDNKERFEKDILDVYSKFFENHKHIYLANLTSWCSMQQAVEGGYEATDLFHKYIYNKNLEFYSDPREGRVDITAFRKLNNKGYNDHVCPECNTRNTISIIGTRTATLSSIAISQSLSTDLDPQTEQQRKVLAFTSSVQDAAHQAGFIEARNYRFTFRASLQKVINNFSDNLSLEKLAEEFITYWKQHADETGSEALKAYYYRFYPTDYLGKSSPSDYIEKGKFLPHFQKEFDSRMRWEVFSEFGYNALIGRTLEKTHSSAVGFDPVALEQVWTMMEEWLAKNESSGIIQKEEFIRFITLLLHRIRTRGAVNHEFMSKFRENSFSLWDLNWQRDARHFLNKNFGPRSRLPKLLTAQKENKGLTDSTYARNKNWFHAYFIKSFQMVKTHVDFLNEFYEALTQALHTANIVDKKEAKDITNHALNPQKIWVSHQVVSMVCQSCGHRVHTIDDKTSGGTCLNYRCTGTYEPDQETSKKKNYYQLVYNRSRSPRIYAADHTGLLERKQRELLERDFKERKRFNSKNAVVATSTLEMGIDIGSLNTALNNSVPPLPANFLQRIGRAGRSSGSALIINFAQSKAHDLYYYQEPSDMMAGDINTPGCYLEAKEILRRHFFAFCIDSWTAANPATNTIPVKLRWMSIDTVDTLAPEFFMMRILNFIKANEVRLFELFKSQYKGQVDPSVFHHLENALASDEFYNFYKPIFAKIQNDIHEISKQKTEIVNTIKREKLGKKDPERMELEQQARSLSGMITSIKKRDTLEHLTNIGALPNYAFPETGVTLMAKVLGNQAEGSTTPPLNKDYEIVRSANQAIKEFAPDNYFYSQGFRFLVSGVNTFDWSDSKNHHPKRFCSNCDHMEPEHLAPKGNCPKCGHDSWSAASNVHVFAKLTSVKSFNDKSSATLTDSSDDRESEIYTMLRHFNFRKDSSKGAWAMKEIPFGIEFVKNVDIIDSNLGKSSVTNARKLKINDLEVPVHGFITCKYCGKSSSNIHQKNYKQHYGYCKHKSIEYSGKADEVFEEIFFFRELKTEALKILLPVQEFNSDAEIKMFQAGIQLGLRKYFEGNPQHIEIADYKEYNHKTLKFDRFLVLFDTIPGGTGYLEKLFNWKEFNKLLKKAYTAIEECECQDKEKDGCYRCIYAYNNQYHRDELSRQHAENRFRKIIYKSEAWESHPNGLSDITNAGQIEESELEERFIRSLRTFATKNDNWVFDEVNDDGTVSYTLCYNNQKGNAAKYHIRPQVNLGPNEGVEFHTRTDFLVICTELTLNGKPVEDRLQIPRIAVYLDGFQYHASEEHNRFKADIKKRRAVNAAGQFLTWTLTWDDLEHFDCQFMDKKDQTNRPDFLALLLNEKGFKETKAKLIKSHSKEALRIHEAANNFERFIKLLEYPLQNKRFMHAWSLFLGLYHHKLLTPSYPPEAIDKLFKESLHMDNYCIRNNTLDGWVQFKGIPENSLFRLKSWVNIGKFTAIHRSDLLKTDQIDKTEWNTYWTIHNILQFFPEYKQPEKEEIVPVDESYQLEDLLGQFNEVYHPILVQLFNTGTIKSEEDEIPFYTLLDEKGNEIAGAELIIPHLKMAVNPFSENDRKVFTKQGYTLKSVNDIKNIQL